jgi:WD40 repeat protein
MKMMISRDGKNLIIVNGVPEYNITVWDLSTLERLGEIELKTDFKFLQVCFSPKDSTLISVLYKECL